LAFPFWARLGIGVGLAATFAYLTTPLAIAAARRFAFYDAPTGYKSHTAPTPYLGGAAVMSAFALAALIGAGHLGRTLPLLGGVAVLFVAGTIDDRRSLSPELRVAIELVLGVVLAVAGLGWKLHAGAGVDAVVTGVWVVAVVNAFNLFDNMDGAASAMALVVAAGAGALAVVTGDVWVAVGSAALCGACLGFLPHNLSSPARIFLGDGGSMPLGFAIAALVANAARSAEPSSLALLVGFLLVGVPGLDTCLVIVSRKRRRVPVLTGGLDHLTHRTRVRMGSAARVAVLLGAAQALLSALVILASQGSAATLIYVVLAFAVCAGATILALEDALPTAPRASGRSTVEHRPRPGARTRLIPLAALAALGLGAGLSPLFSAYYSTGVWVTIGLVLVVGAAAAVIARPPAVNLPLLLALSGFALLGVWSLVSTSWAQAAEQATIEANRWLAYLALLLIAAVLIRGRGRATILLVAVGLGIAVVGLTVLVRMLGSDPAGLFLGGRLNSPLGYVNGEGCVFAMGCWMSLALAERREPWLAGLGLAGVVASAGLTLLSQSRGAAIATAAAIVVVLLVIPGARRRLLALAAVAAGVGALASPVLRVYSRGSTGVLTPAVAHSAASAILLAAAVSGLVWGLLVWSEHAIKSLGARQSLRLRQGASVAAALVVLVPVTAGAVRSSNIEHTVRAQWHAFVHLSDPATAATSAQTRLFSGAGNRYDYWRVAWNVFLAHPVAGVGAGNYAQSYYRERRTTESIQNPHSIELQTLSELGLVGAIPLGMVIAGIVLGIARFRRRTRDDRAARTTMVAATGVAIVWLIDASGDWMQLLPGVSAIAIVAIAVLSRQPHADRAAGMASASGRPLSLLAGAAIVILLAVAGASLLRSGLSIRYVDDARAELATNPAAAIADAGRAVKLDGADLDAYYLRAAGYARFDRATAARETLLDAAAQDPNNFVTWTLLGDLEVRLRDFAQAKRYYTRAHALDPSDPSLTALSANPRSALASQG
jgi:UDP-GlcNAc:undecaprenyl-phosphate/decaprenyl-phosphate GlcNAc-1-phosphate transferase